MIKMKKLYEDDPRAEEFDKVGRYYPKPTQLVRESNSSLSFVKDCQEELANELLKDWDCCQSIKDQKKKEIIFRMNVDKTDR